MDRRLRLLQLDEADATPLYVQLARKLTSAIESGQWLAGEALPSERTLVETLGISRVTARNAMQVLDDQGAIRRTRGAGTFIAPKFEQRLSRLDNFSEMVRPHGLTPVSELIASARRLATDAERTALALGDGDEVIVVTRLRKADDMVISRDSSVLPASVLPAAERIGESLYAYLDRIDKPVLRALQHFRATVADAELAMQLDVPVGEPLLLVSRLGFTHNDVPVESTQTWCINDYYDFVIELRR
ncbi:MULTISPECIES: GntR family transcriptional regulator [Paraburkholderia]|uniref:GntR family transcriptional regulator n=2 Tax=Paraburkholderia TaxID=1822464 RepID=A0A7Y9W7P0_9BURK|nr:GntR family transcriptional regulator [Paraburkholderia bryophila]NYH15268.1 GntR family transcriptional regulator [Paraburkholderia bryophila]NYH26424.1 GntR family transcriptional regulator [Paraburkholderia bryophila]